MTISNETRQKINKFAQEQSGKYLDEAEMTYVEKLNKKAGDTKAKVASKFDKLKTRSEKGKEAQDDMILYMNDYINDLLSQGLSEDEAFARASEVMQFDSGTQQAINLNDRFQEYYENKDLAQQEAIGTFYGGFIILGLTLGALIGFLSGGAVNEFTESGWIYTLIGAAVGLFTGVGLGLIAQGFVTLKKKKN